MKYLTVSALTQEAFEPFGQVIEAGSKPPVLINEGTTERFHNLCDVDVADGGGKPLVNIFRGSPRALPIQIKMMENHPLSSQAFIPLSPHPYLVVVARPTETLKTEDIHCFLAQPTQGVNYAKGVWHHPLLALDDVSDFLVIDRGGEGNNLIETFFEANDFRYISM